MTDRGAILAAMRSAARAAGEIALKAFRPGARTSARIEYKAGGSPVTEADIAANNVLHAALSEKFPDIGWFSEESVKSDDRLGKRRLFIADPIDGTRAFIAGEADWAVSLALAEDGAAVAGVLFAPAKGLMIEASLGQGAFADGNRLQPREASVPPIAAGPKPLLDHLESKGFAFTRHPKIPSLALRLAYTATGAVDIAFASKDAHDWDIAAADVILRESGLELADFKGSKPVYNRADPVHPPLIAGPGGLVERVRAIEF